MFSRTLDLASRTARTSHARQSTRAGNVVGQREYARTISSSSSSNSRERDPQSYLKRKRFDGYLKDEASRAHRGFSPSGVDRLMRDETQLCFRSDDRDCGQCCKRLSNANGSCYSRHRSGKKRSMAGNTSIEVLHVLSLGTIWSGRRQERIKSERNADILPKNTRLQS